MSVLSIPDAPDGWRYVLALVATDVAEAIDVMTGVVEREPERFSDMHAVAELLGVDMRAVVAGRVISLDLQSRMAPR